MLSNIVLQAVSLKQFYFAEDTFCSTKEMVGNKIFWSFVLKT